MPRQADAAWQLWNFSERQTANREVLRINLDETSCRLHYDQKRGLAVCRQRALSRAKKTEIVQDVSRGKLRGCFTLIALICDDASLQPLLPQILLGNEHIFQQRVVDELRPSLASNIHLWRRPSAWATRHTMVEVVQLLARALGTTLAHRRVMLLLDACYIHMGPGFLRACARRGILVHYVPAKLTWLLQPLDTHAFARFKMFVGCEYRQEIMRNGHCELAAMVRIVARAVRKILQGVQWSYAFDGNGFGKGQREVRKTVLDVLDRRTAVGASSQLPTQDQFQLMFPRRTQMPLADLLSFHRDRPVRVPAPVAAAAGRAPAAAAGSGHGAWHGRLRSSSALSLPRETLAEPELAAGAPREILSDVASSSRDGAATAPASSHLGQRHVAVGRPLFPLLRKRSSAEALGGSFQG